MEAKKQALQNFADNYGLTVKNYQFEDKRKNPKFILVKKGCSICQPFTYSEMNIFLLGIYNCKKL